MAAGNFSSRFLSARNFGFKKCILLDMYMEIKKISSNIFHELN